MPQRFLNLICLSLLIAVNSLSLTHAIEVPLLNPEQLQQLLDGSSPPIVLDVRLQKEFQQGHISNARWLNINEWTAASLGDPARGGIGLNNAEYWSKKLSEAGLKLDSHVVVVGGPLTSSSRLWWLLRYAGVDNTQLLDGGMPAWETAKQPTVTNDTQWKPEDTKVDFQADMLAELKDVTANLEKCCIIDSRSEAEYTGTRGVGTRRGHIPDATHIEWKEFVDSQGRFLPKEKLKSVLAAYNVNCEEPIITHCQTGGRSSVVVLAMAVLGERVKNYYRGWGEYSEALTAPVE